MSALTNPFQQVLDAVGAPVMEASWNEFLMTPTGQNMLRQVQDKAKAGVTEAAASNALNLMIFAVAGGAIGGTLFKGPVGIVASAVLAAWSGWRILESVSQAGGQRPVQGLGSYTPLQGRSYLLH